MGMSIQRVTSLAGMPISYSGLVDAQVRMAVAANNIANANTAGYIPKRVISQANPGGGVSTQGIEELYQIDPVLSGLTGNDVVSEFSYVDVAQEAVNLLQAKNAYKTNATALAVQARSEESLMDILFGEDDSDTGARAFYM